MKIYAFADEASPIIDEQIKAMKENGVDGLEIRNVDSVNIAEISDSKAKEVRKKLDNACLRVWTIGSPIGKIDIEKDDFALHTEKFKRTLELADNRDSYKDKVIERLGTFFEIAKGSGINLCHENEKGIYGDIPERCLEIHKALPEMKAIFDPANYVQCGVDTLQAWELLKGYVKYLHIKDALADGSVVPAGKGIGNVEFILGDYIRNGGDSVTVEPHLTVFDGLKGLEKEGDASVVGEVYKYATAEEAFSAAVSALRGLI